MQNGVRRDVINIARITSTWKEQAQSGALAKYAVRRYIGTNSGVFLSYPGTAIERTYDHTKVMAIRGANAKLEMFISSLVCCIAARVVSQRDRGRRQNDLYSAISGCRRRRLRCHAQSRDLRAQVMSIESCAHAFGTVFIISCFLISFAAKNRLQMFEAS